MNLGVLFLAIILAAGSVLVLVVAGSSQARTSPFVDTYGNTTSADTNRTAEVITVAAPPLLSLGTGAVIFLAALVIFVAAMVLYYATKTGGGRYSGRHG